MIYICSGYFINGPHVGHSEMFRTILNLEDCEKLYIVTNNNAQQMRKYGFTRDTSFIMERIIDVCNDVRAHVIESRDLGDDVCETVRFIIGRNDPSRYTFVNDGDANYAKTCAEASVVRTIFLGNTKKGSSGYVDIRKLR